MNPVKQPPEKLTLNFSRIDPPPPEARFILECPEILEPGWKIVGYRLSDCVRKLHHQFSEKMGCRESLDGRAICPMKAIDLSELDFPLTMHVTPGLNEPCICEALDSVHRTLEASEGRSS